MGQHSREQLILPGEPEIMHIGIFALTLDENDSDNQRPFGRVVENWVKGILEMSKMIKVLKNE